MRVDHAADLIVELKALSEEHDQITEALWTHMVRVAAIEFRQEVLIDRLAKIRHGALTP